MIITPICIHIKNEKCSRSEPDSKSVDREAGRT